MFFNRKSKTPKPEVIEIQLRKTVTLTTSSLNKTRSETRYHSYKKYKGDWIYVKGSTSLTEEDAVKFFDTFVEMGGKTETEEIIKHAKINK